MIDGLRRDWRAFRDDAPGRRFEHHHERQLEGSRGKRVVVSFLGVALLVVGIALLFLPGPGLVFIGFALALFAGYSQRLARALDRAEPRLRRRAHEAGAWWRRRRTASKMALVGAIVAAATTAVCLAGVWLLR